MSDVKPCDSTNWLRRRTLSVIDEWALRSSDLGIGVKFDRYVIQIFDSKSSRKASGQPYALTPVPLVGVGGDVVSGSLLLLLSLLMLFGL